MNTEPHYQRLLRQELARRCEANPRYSLRSFARALEIDAGTVSRLIRGSQRPTQMLASRIFSVIDLSPEEQAKFMESAREGLRRARASGPLPARTPRGPLRELGTDLFKAIADWQHAVILELPSLPGFRADPQWVAKRLGISPTEAQLALGRLIQLGLLAVRNGQVLRTNLAYDTGDRHLTSAAHRRNQRQFLEKAIQSLENDPIEVRSMTRWTMAIDPQKLPLAKRMVERFQRRLGRVLGSGQATEIYSLSVALFPNTRQERNP
jgi:uncharacterized protein (TIGR02147 family)